MTKRGKNYETWLCSAVYDESNEELIPEPIGYSGNHKLPAPDIHIDDGGKIHAIELKRTGNDRQTIYYGPDPGEKDDLHQLLTYAKKHPRIVVPYVGVRFNNRQLIMFKLWAGAPNDLATVRSATNLSPVPVTMTRANNLSVRKPATDGWPSASKGNDAKHVLETIGYYR